MYLRTRGLGQSSQQIASTVIGSGGAAASAPIAAALGISVPIVGAAFAGIMLGVEAILNSGCGEACIETSQWANQAEQYLIQNIQTYFGLPQRTTADQTDALNVFNTVWQGLVQKCSAPGLSTAGQKCISDRQSGACTWKQTTTSPLLQYPGEPQPGQCWNWFSGYHDPIANDPDVVSGASSVVASLASGGSLLPLLLVGGLIAWGLLS